MDSLSQGVLGAAIGEVMLGKKIGNKAAFFGAFVATIPDLDVLLYLVYDSYKMLSIHRGISHSILFSILGSLLIAFVLSKLKWFKSIRYRTIYMFSCLCLITHILLDAFTAYGTQLFLPFSNKRVGFDSVNVVDPVYTIPLIIGLLLSLWIFRSVPNRAKYCSLALVFSSVYLIFTLANKQFVKSRVSKDLAIQKIEYNSLLTMPVGLANINWYGVAKGADSIFIKKYSYFKKNEKEFHAFPINENYLNEVNTEVAETMRWFAKGFYTVEKVNGKVRIYNLQVDMRGIVKEGNKFAPTVGYFEIETVNGKTIFNSGSVD